MSSGLASFALRVSSARTIHSAVSALATGRKDQYAVVAVNSKVDVRLDEVTTGVRVSVETVAKSMLATCYMNRDMFAVFTLSTARGDATEIRFKVNLPAWLDALCAHGSGALPTTQLHMAFSEEDCLLQLLVEDAGITSEVQLRVVDADEQFAEPHMDGRDVSASFRVHTNAYDEAFRASPVVAKVIVDSPIVYEAARDCVDTRVYASGGQSVVFTLSDTEPYMRFHTYGSQSSCTVDIPQNSDAFLMFAARGHASHPYHALLLEAAMKAMATAEQTFIRVNEAGMLSLAHKLTMDGGVMCIISFLIMPDEAGSDADDEGAGNAAADEPDPRRKRSRRARAHTRTTRDRLDDEEDYEQFASQPATRRAAREPAPDAEEEPYDPGFSYDDDDGGLSQTHTHAHTHTR